MSENLVLNLDEAKESSGFDNMPNGWYGALCEDAELTSSKAGAPMVKWTFRITDEPYSKRKLFYYTVLNQEFAIGQLKKLVVSLGCNVDMKSFDVAQFCESGTACNMPISLKIGKQKYEGEDRDTIKDFKVSDIGGGFQL